MRVYFKSKTLDILDLLLSGWPSGVCDEVDVLLGGQYFSDSNGQWSSINIENIDMILAGRVASVRSHDGAVLFNSFEFGLSVGYIELDSVTVKDVSVVANLYERFYLELISMDVSRDELENIIKKCNIEDVAWSWDSLIVY